MATEVSPDQMEESTESRRMRMIEPKSLIDEEFLTNFDLGEAIKAIGAEQLWFQTPSGVVRDVLRCRERKITEVIVSNISSSKLRALEKAIASTSHLMRVSAWSAADEVAILKLPLGQHETIHRTIDDYIRDQIVAMGLGSDWASLGSARYDNLNADGNLISRVEGDSARKPLSSRPLRTAFPTLMIEAGVSETFQHLRMKAALWFKISNFAINTVILAKMAKSSPGSIKLEVWNRVPTPANYPATRARPALVARCVQKIDITLADSLPSDQWTSFVVSGGPMILAFNDLFDRNPMPPRESDVTISNINLQRLAVTIVALTD